jgi:hypothetical protein
MQNLFLTTAFLWYDKSQGCHSRFLAGQPQGRHGTWAAATAAFYFAKSRQDLCLISLASQGYPDSHESADYKEKFGHCVRTTLDWDVVHPKILVSMYYLGI